MNRVNWAAMIWSFVPTSTTAPQVCFVPAMDRRTMWPEKSSRTGSWQSALCLPSYRSPLKVGIFFYVHLNYHLFTRFIFNMNPFLHCLNHIAQHSMFAFLLGPFIKQAQARLGIFLMTNFSSEMTHSMKNNCSLL